MTERRDNSRRIDWIDCGRGLILCIIVLGHAAQFFAPKAADAPFIGHFVGALQPSGMPFFFAVSGLFAARYIAEPWPSFCSKRLAMLLWPLIVWTFVERTLFAVLPRHGYLTLHNPWEILAAILFPHDTVLWFIWLLIVFLLVSKLLQALPRPLVLLVATLASIAVFGMTFWHQEKYGLTFLTTYYLTAKFFMYFIFFYAGYAYKDAILRFSRLPLYIYPLLVALSLAGMWGAEMMTSIAPRGGLLLLEHVSAVLSSIFFLRALLYLRPLGRTLIVVGRASLPLYLAHFSVLHLLSLLIAGLFGNEIFSTGRFPLGTTLAVAAILLSFGLAIAAQRPPVSWLFKPPWRQERERAYRPASAEG